MLEQSNKLLRLQVIYLIFSRSIFHEPESLAQSIYTFAREECLQWLRITVLFLFRQTWIHEDGLCYWYRIFFAFGDNNITVDETKDPTIITWINLKPSLLQQILKELRWAMRLAMIGYWSNFKEQYIYYLWCSFACNVKKK